MTTREQAEMLMQLASTRKLSRSDGRTAAAARVLNLLDTADMYWAQAEWEEQDGSTQDIIEECQRRAVMCRIAAEFAAREIGEDNG